MCFEILVVMILMHKIYLLENSKYGYKRKENQNELIYILPYQMEILI